MIKSISFISFLIFMGFSIGLNSQNKNPLEAQGNYEQALEYSQKALSIANGLENIKKRANDLGGVVTIL